MVKSWHPHIVNHNKFKLIGKASRLRKGLRLEMDLVFYMFVCVCECVWNICSFETNLDYFLCSHLCLITLSDLEETSAQLVSTSLVHDRCPHSSLYRKETNKKEKFGNQHNMNIMTHTKEMKRGKQNIAQDEHDVPLQCSDMCHLRPPAQTESAPAWAAWQYATSAHNWWNIYIYQLYENDCGYKSTATIVCGYTAALRGCAMVTWSVMLVFLFLHFVYP